MKDKNDDNEMIEISARIRLILTKGNPIQWTKFLVL